MDNEAFAADGVAPAAAVFVFAEGVAIAVAAGALVFADPPATRVPMVQRPILGAKIKGFLGSSVVPVITLPFT